MARDKVIIKNHGKTADKIIALEEKYKDIKDEDFINKTAEFRERLKNGETLDDLLIEAFAVVREAASRVLGLKAYRVQLIGAIILHQGDIAEMRTGEGKTLTGLFPAYLNALTGDGVHVVTVNEYLSQRDSEINGRVYSLLGLTVGLNGRSLNKDEKRHAYAQDITYTTNAELGFDYLRDNMVYHFEQKVQKKLNYAIIDEADSILIDEARTPLIISGGSQNRINLYKAADTFAKQISREKDIEIDLEFKQVYLSETGIEKAQSYFSLENLFDVKNTELFHLIMNALKANYTFKKEVEYTVQDGEIVLIDQFTGRIMPGRAYSDGLHQALQAKENVEIEEETVTLATITYQNFYRLYNKLSGMTGTAKTEEEEFLKIYNTRVICCPTNKPIIRKDEPDLTFGTKNAKLKKLVSDLVELNELGRPVLIGTTSVESSEQVARYLEKAGLKFEMINAKNHHREAEIVEKAGQVKAITLATNMAGRGTDIKLSDETRKLGGLFVMGVERNEARRIDNQLRGRSGRQGDPGTSRFYVSMEDELMVRFSAPKLRQLFLKLGDDHIESKLLTRSITNAQKKLEGLNFDQRKNVLDYDNILSQQREAMYSQRDSILLQDDLKKVIARFQYTVAFETVESNSELVRGESLININSLINTIDSKLVAANAIKEEDLKGFEKTQIAKLLQEKMMDYYLVKIKDVPENVITELERRTILQAFDKHWTRHINLSQKLRSGIYLQQYAQNNPLHEYVEESARLFNRMKVLIAQESIENLNESFVRSIDDSEVKETKEKKVIDVTDKDINDILSEWNIDKEKFSRPVVEERFNQLQEELKDDLQKLERVRFQFFILNGLMTKLDEIYQEQNKRKMELSQEDVDNLLNKYDLLGKKFTKEDIKEKVDSALVGKNEEERKTIMIDAQILMAISEKLNSVKEYVVKDKKGKVKKVIKVKDDGSIDPDEIKDTEQVQTKVKIG
ncbi:preprotein translocase subunit SecA [Spiroplasma turonicum]|uniref:Protein translocase subunit SecA n=1 Tax=Spiroplasma turonicum TaxID=216946 RepID=A0A0K1P4T1_9MOLU|nr:preprotein translocase subunit SecA [Spiroplasma turonicum]AKU79301.1 preprotein translocase subunit SecA [Spiroplasma turonicum]ALX70324.1 preprotein translocase subunit SecA [Spiroplasma turonicum]